MRYGEHGPGQRARAPVPHAAEDPRHEDEGHDRRGQYPQHALGPAPSSLPVGAEAHAALEQMAEGTGQGQVQVALRGGLRGQPRRVAGRAQRVVHFGVVEAVRPYAPAGLQGAAIVGGVDGEDRARRRRRAASARRIPRDRGPSRPATAAGRSRPLLRRTLPPPPPRRARRATPRAPGSGPRGERRRRRAPGRGRACAAGTRWSRGARPRTAPTRTAGAVRSDVTGSSAADTITSASPCWLSRLSRQDRRAPSPEKEATTMLTRTTRGGQGSARGRTGPPPPPPPPTRWRRAARRGNARRSSRRWRRLAMTVRAMRTSTTGGRSGVASANPRRFHRGQAALRCAAHVREQ